MFGCFGNGITVFRQGEDDFVAHISTTRNITYYRRISAKEKLEIEEFVQKEVNSADTELTNATK